MLTNGTARWVLTTLFAVATAYQLYGLRRRPAVDGALRVLVSVGTVALLWPWGLAVPVMVYVLVFTAAALWFVFRALFGGSARMGWGHAVLMMSVVWLAVVASLSSASASTASMAGMDMASMSTMSTMDMGGSVSVPPVGLWVWVPVLVLVGLFVVAGRELLSSSSEGRG